MFCPTAGEKYPFFPAPILVFFIWPDLPKKGFCGLNQKNWTLHIVYVVLHIQISLVRNFNSNWEFWFLDQICPKTHLQSKTKKVNITMELHIWISLGTKLQLKLIILSFQIKCTPKKGTSSRKQNKQSKDYKRLLCFDVFKHFEALKDLINLNILKEKLVLSCLLGSFHLKIV